MGFRAYTAMRTRHACPGEQWNNPSARAQLVSLAMNATSSSIGRTRWGCSDGTLTTACPLKGNVSTRSHGRMDAWLYNTLFCDICPTPRTFVELGAHDGMHMTNTKMFEDQLNFAGLLIEAQPDSVRELLRTRRAGGRNVIIPEAVCATPGAVTFTGNKNVGTAGILSEMSETYREMWKARLLFNHTVPCRPLTKMLHIASISKVDFFSLDVEGAEQLVLRTMNWRVPVGVWLIELSCTSGAARNDAIRLELARHGYGPYNLDKVPLPPERFLDNEVFLHRDLLHQLPQRVATCRRCEQI